VPGETIHNMPFAVTADAVLDALKSIERLARSVRVARGLPAPISYVATH
jgi:glycerol dehydrogenase